MSRVHSLLKNLLDDAPPGGGRQWLFGLALAVGFGLAYRALGHIQFYHWLITNGLLFSMLWLLPRHWWPWLAASTILSRIATGASILPANPGLLFGHWNDWPQFLLGNLLEPFLVVTGVFWLQHWGVRPGTPTDSRSITRLHVAAVLSALAVTAKDVLYVLNDGVIADVRRDVIFNPVSLDSSGAGVLLATFALKNFMGSFVGILLIAPLALWCVSKENRAGSRAIVRNGLWLLLPVMLVFLLLGMRIHDASLAELLRRLLLVVVAIAAIRDGWRGASLAVLAVSVAVAIDDHIGHSSANPIHLQLFIAITGVLGLLLGAAIDELRRQRTDLDTARLRASGLAGELAEAAAGNLRAEERERHRIASELHDEFGQNLTALQTHMRVLLPDFHAAGKGAALGEMLDIARTMRQNLGAVLERLRPAALDELGLFAAIDTGSIRRLAEGANLHFELQLQGDARLLALLEDTHRVAAYRLVQESVTNIVRHAYAHRCTVRLRIERRRQALWLFLDIRDDGIGRGPAPRAGSGLSGMRDRVIALDGRLHLRDRKPGLRVHALLRQAMPH